VAAFAALMLWALRRARQERSEALRAGLEMKRLAESRGWRYLPGKRTKLWTVSHGGWSLEWTGATDNSAAGADLRPSSPRPAQGRLLVVSQQELRDWRTAAGRRGMAVASGVLGVMAPSLVANLQQTGALLTAGQMTPLTGARSVLGMDEDHERVRGSEEVVRALRAVPVQYQAGQRLSAGWNERGVRVVVRPPERSVVLMEQVLSLGLALGALAALEGR